MDRNTEWKKQNGLNKFAKPFYSKDSYEFSDEFKKEWLKSNKWIDEVSDNEIRYFIEKTGNCIGCGIETKTSCWACE